MSKLFSARQAGELLGMPHREVIRRINRQQIKATKVGWNWMLKEEWINEVMEADWYKRNYRPAV